jgi:hypothetical protein
VEDAEWKDHRSGIENVPGFFVVVVRKVSFPHILGTTCIYLR